MKRETTMNVDAERWVLGLCLLDESGGALDEAVARLKADDFGLRAHRILFRAMRAIHAANESPLDDLKLITKLEQSRSDGQPTGVNDLETVGGFSAIADLTSGVPRVDPVPKIQLVREYSRRRILAGFAQNLLNACLDPTLAFEDVEVMAEVPDGATEQTAIMSLADVLGERSIEITRQYESPQALPGFTTTLDGLDKITTGIRPGELWIIGAIPGAGKSSFIFQTGLANAKADVSFGLFSLEMTRQGIADRLLAAEALDRGMSFNLAKLRNPRSLRTTDLQDLHHTVSMMEPYQFIVDDTAGLSLAALRARARLMVRRYRCQLLAVDYLQLIEAEGESRREKVASVARSLKNLAKELGVGIIAASQLSRPQKGVATAPTLHDLKESGEIEAAADAVLLLHRPARSLTGLRITRRKN